MGGEAAISRYPRQEKGRLKPESGFQTTFLIYTALNCRLIIIRNAGRFSVAPYAAASNFSTMPTPTPQMPTCTATTGDTGTPSSKRIPVRLKKRSANI